MSLKSQLESILFVSEKPVSLKDLSTLLAVDDATLSVELEQLSQEYESQNRGFRILRLDSKYQLASNPEWGELVQRFLKIDYTAELTRPSFETLSIIAYRGPIGKAELELIRGVNCSLIIRNLLMRGLIEGHDNKKTGQMRYTITHDFLSLLGISRQEDLPDFEKLNSNELLKKLLNMTSEEGAHSDISST